MGSLEKREKNKMEKNMQKKKKEDAYLKEKNAILNHLDLNTDMSGRLGKQLQKQRGTYNLRGASKSEKLKVKNMLRQKERNVIPLNHNVGFWRLTQLFGRSLYIKYFIKHIDPQVLRRKSANYLTSRNLDRLAPHPSDNNI